MLAIYHLILTAGCLIFTLKAVTHEPPGIDNGLGGQVSNPDRSCVNAFKLSSRSIVGLYLAQQQVGPLR